MNMPDDNDDEDDMRSVNLLALSSPDEKEAPSDDDSCTVDPTAPASAYPTTATTSSTRTYTTSLQHHHHHPYDEPPEQQQESPATRTLNNFSQSQESVDLLNYNSLSQLECAAVNALVLTKRRSHSHPQMQMDSGGGGRRNSSNSNNHLGDSDSSAASPEQKKPAATSKTKKSTTDNGATTHPSNSNHRTAAARRKRARPAPQEPSSFSRTAAAALPPSQQQQRSQTAKKKKKARAGVAVDQVDPHTGRAVATFASLTEAAAAAGCCYNVISQIARGTHRAGIYQGWTYRYHDSDDDDDDDDEAEESSEEEDEEEERETAPWPSRQHSQDTAASATAIKKQNGRAVAVQQVDLRTGRVVQTFGTLSEAARVVGCSRHVVTDLVRGNSRHDSYQGRYTFRYARTTTVTTAAAAAEESSVAVSTSRSGGNKSKTTATPAATKKKAPPPPPLPTTASKKKRSRSTSTSDDSRTGSSSRASISVEKVVRYASSISSSSNKRRKIVETTTSNKEKKGGVTASIPVEQLDIRTGAVVRTYSSLTAASNGTGVRRRDITNIVRGKVEDTTINGWTFRYASGYDGSGAADSQESTTAAFSQTQLSPQLSQQPTVQRRQGKARPIHELDAATQRVVRSYPKIAAAIATTGIKSTTMYKILRGDLADWQGKTFRYCDNNGINSENPLEEATPPKAFTEEESVPWDSCSKNIPPSDRFSDQQNNILSSHNPSVDNAAASSPGGQEESALRRASKLKNAVPDVDESSPCSLLLELARGSVQQQQHEKQQVSSAKPSAILKNKEEKSTKAGRRVTVSREQDDPMLKTGTAKEPKDSSSPVCKGLAGSSGTAPAKATVKRELSSPPASFRSGSNEDSANGTANATGTAEASKKDSKNSRPLPRVPTKRDKPNDAFETLNITVTEDGPLGIRILPTKPPEELVHFLRKHEYLNETDEAPPKILNVRGLHSPSIGGDAGMRKDDWLLVPSGETGMHIDSKQVKTIVKDGGRPINFLLVRPLQDDNAAEEKISPSDGLQKKNEDGGPKPGSGSEHKDSSKSRTDNGTRWSSNNSKDDCVSKQASDQHVAEQLALAPLKNPNASRSPLQTKANESDLSPVKKATSAAPKEKSTAFRSTTSKESATKSVPTKETDAAATTFNVKPDTQPSHSIESRTKNISTNPTKPALVSLSKESGANKASVAEQAAAAAPSKPRVSRPSQSLSTKNKESGSSKPSDVVPFCALCNGDPSARSVHHAWCPKNPCFLKSGAQAVLLRLKRGMHELGCRSCAEEYQTGIAKSNEEHSNRCRRMKKQDLLEDQNNKTQKATTSHRSKSKQQTVNDDEDDEDDDEERSQSSGLSQLDDDDDGSFFASPGKSGKRSFMKLELVKEKPGPVKQPRTSSSQFVRKSAATNKAASQVAESSKNIRQSSQAKSKASLLTPKEPSRKKKDSLRAPSPMMESDEEETSDEEDLNETLKVEWEECANFWGPSGHLDDDVVVFSSDPVDLIQRDPIFPAVRFEMDLFSRKARYGRTHTAPEDGFQTIVLTRDFAGQRPWGFTVERHEFGGACLVSTVDPLSPAGGAAFVGAAASSRNKAPLRVNDLLVLVNGKTVGGMTAERLVFELATSGAELILTVARYKRTTEVQKEISHAEESYLKSVDEIVNDNGRLGWTEIGGGSIVNPPSSEKVEASEVHTVLPPSEEQHSDCTPVLDSPEVAKNESKESEPLKSAEQPVTSPHSKEKKNELELAPGGDAKIKNDLQLDKPTDSPDSSQEGKPPTENCDQDSTLDDDLPTLESSPLRFTLVEQDDHHSVALPSSPESTVPGKGLQEDDDEVDDGNAWYGCVCGKLHSEMVPVFWIQCEACKTWYNAASECVGFAEAAAKHVKHWSCWGCPDIPKLAAKTTATPAASLPSPSSLKSTDTASCMEARHRTHNSNGSPLLPSPDIASPKKNHTSNAWRTLPTKGEDETETSDEEPQVEQKEIEPFKKGDLVFVKEHGWPGVNNPEGIAKILSASVDPEVGNVYDISYVVGSRHRGVLHQFMTPHYF